jgi:citrate lyase subunit alpha/citrate CoA-transferase
VHIVDAVGMARQSDLERDMKRMTSNAVERMVPTELGILANLTPYAGIMDRPVSIVRTGAKVRTTPPGHRKVLPTIRAALEAADLKDGATLSFHHHLRNGDAVAIAVIREAAAMGLQGLTIAPSSLFPVHGELVPYIRSGVIRQIYTGYVTGPVADAVARSELAEVLVMHTHGGRVRLIESGELHIDAAFIAAPAADCYGNLNGVDGPSACGSLGYADVDARFADTVIAVTDCLVPYPACPIAISQDFVDHVVVVDSIGDASQIVSGTTRPTNDPTGLQIAQLASSVIEASGLLCDEFSFQTGAGGISLAVASCLREVMHRKAIRGSFAAGGITGHIVQMHEEGLFRSLLDVQCFDLPAVASFRRNPHHQAMTASMYANPHNKGAVVNRLSAMVLGATEIDLAFNVNVTTGAGGRIMGGSGGHSDTAAGAQLAIVTTRLCAREVAKIVDNVATVTTPGETIDVLVTEVGVAVNPRRAELRERLIDHGIPVQSIESLRDLAKKAVPPVICSSKEEGKIVGLVQYRDGTLIDVIRGNVA